MSPLLPRTGDYFMTETATEKTESKRFKWSTLLVPVVCSLITAFITYNVQQYSGRLRTLKYVKQVSAGIIKRPELNGRNLKLMLDDRPIDNVSTATISVFNTTDQDFEDVLLEVVFSGDGKSKPVLIQPKIQQPPEAYEEVKLADRGDNALRLAYKVKIANRSNQAIFSGDYIFEGEKAPTVEVGVQKRGLGLEEVSLDAFVQSQKPISWMTWTLAAEIMFFVVWGVYMVKMYNLSGMTKRARQ